MKTGNVILAVVAILFGGCLFHPQTSNQVPDNRRGDA